MNKAGRGKVIFIMFTALLVFLAVFYFIANGKRQEPMTKLSATEATVQKDLSINYPQTPKAVVRYYAELSQCMYDPTNTDEEVEAIARQSRELFDEELKSQQSDDDYLQSLKNTIAGFLQDNRRIVSFTITPSSEVVYNTLDIGEVASLYCTYTMQKGSVSYSDPEHFLLRKDGDGRWKILGWQSASLDEDNTKPVDYETDDQEESGSSPDDNGPVNAGDSGNGGNEGTDAPKITIEKPRVEIPTVEIDVPGVN